MSDENKSCCNTPEAEPTATRSAAPLWIIVVTLVLIFFGGHYLDTHGGLFSAKVYAPYKSPESLDSFQPLSGAAAVAARGKKVYESVCGICHSPDGMGKAGQAPPLAGSEFVNAKNFKRVACIPLQGLAGPVTVAGKEWNLSMAPMGASLSDEDLAAVLTYIRTSWGNTGGEVTADDLKKIRDAIGAHPLPLTAADLAKMPQ
jgi:mono/diheme cytochrome c family protein